MSNIVIQVDDIGKQYFIGQTKEKYRTMRDAIMDSVTAPFRRAKHLIKGHATGAAELNEEFWALRNISFEVKQGEVVGIIGRNGAGKSTLLKLLSRITEPTEGFIRIRGRVSSLLEVGTGFHQELTGRENVYLNGAILGMRRNEIDRKFDEMVAFAEVEKFIDTPVKHYSSGMRLRLAFSVAAHLEPEIMIIDEVLAVGDARFQQRCLNKMEDVSNEGRTVLFVSHSMPAVTRLCQRGILLEEGRTVIDDTVDRVVGVYMSSGLGTMAARQWTDLAKAPGDKYVRLLSVRARTKDGKSTDIIDIREPIGLEMEYEVLQPERILLPYYNVFNQDGVKLCTSVDLDKDWQYRPRPTGRYISTAWVPGNLLSEGTIFVGPAMLSLNPNVRHFSERDAIAFQVAETFEGEGTARGVYAGDLKGVIRPMLDWETQFIPSNGNHPINVNLAKEKG